MKDLAEGIAREQREHDEFEKNTKHEGYTIAELRVAFERVQDSQHWKNAIRAFCRAEQKEITRVAIEFYTATTPTFTHASTGWLLVIADGYRRGPAGDN
jgi:hypothetical protein